MADIPKLWMVRRAMRYGWLLLVGLAPLSGALALANNDNALWRPRFVTPAIVALDSAAHRQFLAEVRAPASARGWSLTLSNDLRAWPCQVLSATHATINRGTEPGWQIKASVPADVSPELFALAVSSSEGTSVQGQAVSVAPVFATDFYILHITDEQIVNVMHTDPSGQYWHMVGTWEEMKWMQEPINLIHPRFVLITGDQIDYNGALDGWNNWSNWGYLPKGKRTFTPEETKSIELRLSALYKDCHKGYRVPYVEAPGNHDVTPANKTLLGSGVKWHPLSATVYETEFGQRSWSFRMDDFYVLMQDWTDHALKTWATHDYEAASQDPGVKYRLIGQHFNADQAVIPSSCDLMLVGHGHTTATRQSSPYYIYEGGPAFRYGTASFFNFKRSSEGWACEQTASPRDTAKDVWPLFTDNGATRKVHTDQPDPMNLSTNCVTIVNDLPQTFYDGRVRFVLNKGTYHAVENGTILAQYDCLHQPKTVVLVKVSLPANGSVTVRVATGNADAAQGKPTAHPGGG